VGNVLVDQRRRSPKESWDKDSPCTNGELPSWRADERVEVRKTS
jgi:hypothetical protein